MEAPSWLVQLLAHGSSSPSWHSTGLALLQTRQAFDGQVWLAESCPRVTFKDKLWLRRLLGEVDSTPSRLHPPLRLQLPFLFHWALLSDRQLDHVVGSSCMLDGIRSIAEESRHRRFTDLHIVLYVENIQVRE